MIIYSNDDILILNLLILFKWVRLIVVIKRLIKTYLSKVLFNKISSELSRESHLTKKSIPPLNSSDTMTVTISSFRIF